MGEIWGKVIINGAVVARSGLHIGGSTAAYQIGGVDDPVVKDGQGRPYIPGSSLRGKLRSLLERLDGRPPSQAIGKYVKIHVCQDAASYARCDVCQIFGVPAGQFNRQARLQVRDAPLDLQSIEAMRPYLELPYTEVKWENAIDRVTSAANPRQQERVPAGARFSAEMVLTLLERKDERLVHRFVQLLQLLEDDALGGAGSRGAGRVAFEDLSVLFRPAAYYEGTGPEEALAASGNLRELLSGYSSWANAIRGA